MNKEVNKQLVLQAVCSDLQCDNIVRLIVATLLLSLLFSLTAKADTLRDKILSMRDQAAPEEKILEKRLNDLILDLMRSNNIDTWVLIVREYNENPVVKAILPGTWFSARRRTVLIFWTMALKD